MTQIFSDIDLIHVAPVSYDLELTPCCVEKCVLIFQKVGSCVTKALVINDIMVGGGQMPGLQALNMKSK